MSQDEYSAERSQDEVAVERKNRKEEREKREQAASVARRTAVENRFQTERAWPVFRQLVNNHASVGIVALKGADINYFIEGFVKILQKRGGSLLQLVSEGSIQGKALGHEHADDVSQKISRHRHEHGPLGIVAFTGFDFGDSETIGTPLVARRVTELIDRQNDAPGDRSNIGIFILGSGNEEHLPTHTSFSQYQQHPVAGRLAVRYTLGEHHELSTVPGNLAAPQHRLEVEQPFGIVDGIVQSLKNLGNKGR